MFITNYQTTSLIPTMMIHHVIKLPITKHLWWYKILWTGAQTWTYYMSTMLVF